MVGLSSIEVVEGDWKIKARDEKDKKSKFRRGHTKTVRLVQRFDLLRCNAARYGMGVQVNWATKL
jgi:hypothetical protein